MFKINEVKACELAGTEFPELNGREFLIYGVSDPEAPEDNSIVYVRTDVDESYRNVKNTIFVTKEEVDLPELDESCVQIKAAMQKSMYGILLERFRALLPKAEMEQVNGSFLSKDRKLGQDVQIAPFCVIGQDVQIGDRCRIGAGTIIKDHVQIGNDVEIQEKCLIGVDDMDVYRLEDGICRDLPHLAGTVIEDGCLLMAGSVVAAGDSRTTVLGKSSVVGMLGDVGHNCVIGAYSSVGGKSSISGHCNLGEHVYVAPMAVTTNRIDLGDQSYLGIGAVAIKDVPAGEKQFGNPARKVLEMKKK
jgi:UDP-3-O-[3-hydroxymyristoyl] glucosamine N-acyltransferase